MTAHSVALSLVCVGVVGLTTAAGLTAWLLAGVVAAVAAACAVTGVAAVLIGLLLVDVEDANDG